MRSFRSSTSSTAGLISIVFFYVLLILLILIFSNQILKDISGGGQLTNAVIIPLGILLPAVLIGIIIFNIVRLFRDRAAGKPGVRFKIRLILFFSFIAFLSSIPQGILSISFIDTTLTSWFSARIGKALEGGLHIALKHYNAQVDNLESFSSSRVFLSLMRDIDYRPERVWENIHTTNSLIDSMQVFSHGQSKYFFGDDRGKIQPNADTFSREGIVVKDSSETVTALRIFEQIGVNENQYDVILSSFLPENFDDEAGGLTRSLEVFRQLEQYNTIFRIVLILFYSFFSVPILLLSILVSFQLSDEIIRPVVNLEEATRKVAEGDFTIRILSRSRDELSVLTKSFNSMVSELARSRKKILQTEKVTAWQEIAQRMAHEIKNPLTPIKLSAERLLRKYEKDREGFEKILTPAVSSIIREVDNLNTLLQEFRDFARLPAPALRPVNLYPIIQEAIDGLRVTYPHIAFITDGVGRDSTVRADKMQIGRVFQNLISNAIEAMKKEGEINISDTLVSKGNLHYSRIQIQDTGPGIPEEYHDKVFNPYFTTKEYGTGLGLAIVDRIIFDHNGQIWFETEENEGTTFFIDLPAE